MARAWPFEGLGEPEEPFHDPESFVRRRGPGVQAVVVRIGLHDAQLVLVDRDGRWERWVYTGQDDARAAAENLGLPLHLGAFPEELRALMNVYVRRPEELARSPYPERGRVGPVRPYPENRPRRVEREEPQEPQSDVDLSLHPGLAP
jgi:hypothetical protein